jgi:molecular chaperone GrpE
MMGEDKQVENTQVPMAENPEISPDIPENGASEEAEAAQPEAVAASGAAAEEADTPVSVEDAPDMDASSDSAESFFDAAFDDEKAAEEGESGIDYKAAVREMTRTIEDLKKQLEDRASQHKRLAADFDNFRKRTQREKEELEQQIKCNTVVELLPVVDNFERARAQIKPQTDAETNIHKSYQGVYKDLVERLKRIGVAPMRAEGKEFDPNWHEAVMREPTSEHPEGTVMEELVRGYLLGDRVLRHAMVKVAAAPEPGADSAASPEEPSDT